MATQIKFEDAKDIEALIEDLSGRAEVLEDDVGDCPDLEDIRGVIEELEKAKPADGVIVVLLSGAEREQFDASVENCGHDISTVTIVSEE